MNPPRSNPEVPDYAWIPPEWPNSRPRPCLHDTVKPNCEAVQLALIGAGLLSEPFDSKKTLPVIRDQNWEVIADDLHPGQPPCLWKRPHPASDFSHSHGLGNARGGASGPKDNLDRMSYYFDWVVHVAAKLLSELWEAYRGNDQVRYQSNRQAYLDLLHKLDERDTANGEPELGRPVKWLYVMPAIQEHELKGILITLKWNPHSSSSWIHG